MNVAPTDVRAFFGKVLKGKAETIPFLADLDGGDFGLGFSIRRVSMFERLDISRTLPTA